MKIDFTNTQTAFALKSDAQLKKARLLFQTIARPGVVDFLQGSVKLSIQIGLPIKGIIKATVFEHFCGGETIEECTTPIAAMYTRGVNAILDYSVEGKANEEDFERTKNTTLKTIAFAQNNPAIPLSVFKPTGLGRIDLYEKVSKRHTLSTKEEQEWQRVRKRYFEIADAAAKAGVPVMVDAEESWIQPAIDDLVEELMHKHNTEKAVVYNTAQLYRWDRLPHLKEALERARNGGYQYGVKIVRGAYMEKERERAKEMGYPDPIQPNKEASDRDYDAAIQLLLENIDITYSVVGTHNEKSSQLVADLLEKNNVEPNNKRVYVAQLYGMSDHISFNMAAAGFNVVKYLPFGPVKDVLPYLFRRAEENTSIAGQTSRELNLINAELKRRKKAKKASS